MCNFERRQCHNKIGTNEDAHASKWHPYIPTTPADTQKTVRYLNVVPSTGESEIVKAYWTAHEAIPTETENGFTHYTYAAPRKDIRKNEDAFLHIHTRGLYGEQVTVELYERDILPRDFKVGQLSVFIEDNVACVAIPRADVLTVAGAYRSLWMEGGDWGIKITDKQANIIQISTSEDTINISANKDVNITAGETMTLNAKTLNINVTKNMTTVVGQDQKTSVGGTVENTENELKETIAENVTRSIGQQLSETTGGDTKQTSDGDFIIQCSGKALLQGATDARISKG